MRTLIQRVKNAKVIVDNKTTGQIEKGLLVFFACHKDDEENQIDYLVDKIINLRIFPDDNDKLNLSILDVKGSILVVSQFTLYASLEKGRRPSFTESLEPKLAKTFYEIFVDKLKKHLTVETGIFGAKMEVHLINDGPLTFMLDAK